MMSFILKNETKTSAVDDTSVIDRIALFSLFITLFSLFIDDLSTISSVLNYLNTTIDAMIDASLFLCENIEINPVIIFFVVMFFLVIVNRTRFKKKTLVEQVVSDLNLDPAIHRIYKIPADTFAAIDFEMQMAQFRSDFKMREAAESLRVQKQEAYHGLHMYYSPASFVAQQTIREYQEDDGEMGLWRFLFRTCGSPALLSKETSPVVNKVPLLLAKSFIFDLISMVSLFLVVTLLFSVGAIASAVCSAGKQVKKFVRDLMKELALVSLVLAVTLLFSVGAIAYAITKAFSSAGKQVKKSICDVKKFVHDLMKESALFLRLLAVILLLSLRAIAYALTKVQRKQRRDSHANQDDQPPPPPANVAPVVESRPRGGQARVMDDPTEWSEEELFNRWFNAQNYEIANRSGNHRDYEKWREDFLFNAEMNKIAIRFGNIEP